MPAILSACGGAVRGEIFLIFPRLTNPQIKPIKVQINVMGGWAHVGVGGVGGNSNIYLSQDYLVTPAGGGDW